MSRSHRRVSRPLLAILAMAILAGGVSLEWKIRKQGPLAAKPPATGAIMLSASALPSIDSVTSGSGGAADVAPGVAQGTTRPAQEQAAALQPTSAFPPEPTTLPSPASFIERPGGALTSIADAEAKIKAVNLLEARGSLNDLLKSGELDDSDAARVKADISAISQTVVFGRQHFPDDPYGGVYVVQPGENLTKIALAHGTTWELLSRINGTDPRHLRAGQTIKIIQGPFFAVVDKKKFTMDIYLGGLPEEKSSMYVTTYPVGLGLDNSTPVGTWMIEPHRKLKHPTYYSPRGQGVVAADDPKNPLGGYWIGLTGTGGEAVGKISYGIHGTIDQSSIGKQSSMGCIRLHPDDIAMVYDMMVEGKSTVVVKD